MAVAMFVFFYLVFPSTLLPDHVKVSAVNRGEGKVRRADLLEIKITIGMKIMMMVFLWTRLSSDDFLIILVILIFDEYGDNIW